MTTNRMARPTRSVTTPAAPAELPAVAGLLSASGLPHDGLAEPVVQVSAEFTGACPASAAVFALGLDG